ncbi:MAG TPA: glycosyltransferase [Acidimicrobiales bacterium]|nr:glycosyltransferase [Acidimicrobiales bacterium]
MAPVPPPAAAQATATVSVVIAAYADERWDDLVEAVGSVGRQDGGPEVVVAVDHNRALAARARRELPGVVVVANTGPRGASGARNAGAAAATGEIVVFLDDDAVAAPDWLGPLLAPFADAAVLGVGGRIVPRWEAPVPGWFPPELGWVVGATDRCLPPVRSRVRNVWSGNMAVRHAVFEAVGGFRPDFGLTGGRPWPEDTELCLRAQRVYPSRYWLFEPAAVVAHKVPPQRARIGYFLARSWYQGRTKAEMAWLLDGPDPLGRERAYVLRTLPRAAARGVVDTIGRRDRSGVARALVVVAASALGAVGLVAGRVRLWRRAPRAGEEA